MSLLSKLWYSQTYGKCLTHAQKYLPNSAYSYRNSQNDVQIKKTIVIEPLDDRVLMRVRGTEVNEFLQGLVTNNMTQLQNPDAPKSIYAMILNKSGRVLYDTIIYRTDNPDTYLIECDKTISSELSRHLRIHRVRRNIQIDNVDNEYSIWSIFDPVINENENQNQSTLKVSPIIAAAITNNNGIISRDPRLEHLGKRIITRPDVKWSDLARLYHRLGEVSAAMPTDNQNYRIQRYRLGVAEGIKEMPPGKALPLEANVDYLNGISFNKGCYVGQELTARTYYTGVIRKRHMPIRFVEILHNANGVVETPSGVKVGNVIGAAADKAVGLLRIEHVLRNSELLVNGTPCIAEKPKWWPKENY